MPLASPPLIVSRVPARERPAMIGGTTASILTLPWLAFISGQFANGTGESCSGTVVAARVVPAPTQFPPCCAALPPTCSTGLLQTVWDSSFDPVSELCTLDQGPQAAGACRGDSSEPFLADQDGSTVELGLAIFVATGCATALTDVYTAADAIAPWVAAELPTLTASVPGIALAAGAPAAGCHADVSRPGPAAASAAR